MRYITEQLQTPVRGECDVLVAGGGIAGIAAAMAAARQGAQVTLVEGQFTLGGLATVGLITYYLPLCDGCGHQVIYGIGEELLRLSILHGAEKDYPAAWLDGGTPEERISRRFKVGYNPSLFAFDAERVLRELGVEIIYGCRVSAVSLDAGRISAVVLEGKGGREAIAVRGGVVDATGDADVAAQSGAETAVFTQGNLLAGWYYSVEEGGRKLHILGVAERTDDEAAKLPPEKKLTNRRFLGLDSRELSEMTCLSHQATMQDYLQKHEGDLAADLASTATIPQIRMTRRIVGLAEPDITDDKREFADSIGLTGSWRRRGPIYAIPYGAIVARGVNNLYAAGRCISVTERLWDVTRVIPTCAVTGEAAGIAAAMLGEKPALDSAALPVSELQERLRGGGVKLKVSEVLPG